MPARSIRVLPAEYGWVLEVDGLAEAPRRFTSLESAIAAGWARAQREKAELHIHRLDGEVRLRTAVSDDPPNVDG